MDTLFPGWAASEIISIIEQVFDCATMFVAVILVGLRDA